MAIRAVCQRRLALRIVDLNKLNMNSDEKLEGVWFVYDGACPMCSSAAHALRIKKDYGSLTLLDAREAIDHPLLMEVTRRGFDLDEGMVIYTGDHFYHGKEALKFMSRYGDARNVFTFFSKGLFWSNTISALTYPWMRGMRNWLLRRKSAPRIDNLRLRDEPIFKSIFGDTWDALPPALQKHYANRPYCEDVTVAAGKLDVMSKQPFSLLAPLLKILGQIPARNETNVPVTVQFKSDLETKSFWFVRRFHFKDERPYIFHSRMLQIKDNEVIEVMRFGFSWKLSYSWDGEKVLLQHRGYALNLFGHFIPIPLTMIMGEGYAEEIAIDDDTFEMVTHITHPWFGKIYQYKGRFKIKT